MKKIFLILIAIMASQAFAEITPIKSNDPKYKEYYIQLVGSVDNRYELRNLYYVTELSDVEYLVDKKESEWEVGYKEFLTKEIKKEYFIVGILHDTQIKENKIFAAVTRYKGAKKTKYIFNNL